MDNLIGYEQAVKNKDDEIRKMLIKRAFDHNIDNFEYKPRFTDLFEIYEKNGELKVREKHNK